MGRGFVKSALPAEWDPVGELVDAGPFSAVPFKEVAAPVGDYDDGAFPGVAW